MKRNVIIAILVIQVLLVSTGALVGSTGKPPKTTLSASMTGPVNGLEVEDGGSFDVTGIITALKGDAGLVMSYVQYAVGEGSSDFNDLGGSDTSVLHIVSGEQPQSQSLVQDESYAVSWTLAGPAGSYEIRIRSDGELAKSGESDSVTVTILAPPPPPGVEVVVSEEMDTSIGFGSVTGSYANTYSADGLYEILTEEKNTCGTKKPVDDTTELGWIYTFDVPTPRTATIFYFYGYAEFGDGDTDTAFLIQEESGGSWITILEISHTGFSKLRQATISDQTNNNIRLRIIDNDCTVGNKEISSLHIDQAIIGVDGYISPSSGIEILTMPYTDHNFQAWENFGNDWYHDADITISGVSATDIEVVDIDFDGRNEFVVAETISETIGAGVVEIFDLDFGTSPIEILPVPSVGGLSYAVMSVEVGNFDNDNNLEIVAGLAGDGGAIFWDQVDDEYQISMMLRDTGNLDLIAAGNLDTDPELEIVFANGWDAVPEVIVYDYDPIIGTWINTANYSNFANTGSEYNWFYSLEINDIDNDDIGEIYVLYAGGSFRILTYTGNQLVDFWTQPNVTALVDVGFCFTTGDISGDGVVDVVFYSPFLDTGTGFRVFEYDDILGFVNTYNISNPGMANIFGSQMAIGDVDGDFINELVVSGGPGGIYSVGKLFIFRYDTLIFSAELNANESNSVVICDYDNDAP